MFGGPGGVNGGVPPVLKRRTGELVAVIKNAMDTARSTSSPQGSAEDSREGAKMVVSAVVEESEAISSSMPPSTTARPTNESRLWTITPSSTSTTIISISRSSMFGVEISGERAQEKEVVVPSTVGGEKTHFAPGSVLFGSALAEVSIVV